MAGRRKGRILAFQALYAWDVSGTPVKELLGLSWLDDEKRSSYADDLLAFSRLIVSGTIENIEAVDSMIKAHLENWDFNRLSKVDLALLRISAYTLLFQKDIPFSIVIDEAVEIAKEYSAVDSYRFVNGVLDGIRKAAV